MREISQDAEIGEGPTEVCECKIYRTASEYGFEGLYECLTDLWLGDEDYSLRELQDEININILESALREAGETPIVGEVESRYEVLTDDEYTAGERTEMEGNLRDKGVDVEEVKNDFVSHQTVANHFYDCLDKKKSRSQSSEENDLGNVRSLKKMAEERLEQIVEKHRNRPTENPKEIDVGDDYRVETDFYIVAEDGERVRFSEYLE